MPIEYADFRERVRAAAEAALKTEGSVGPLELFQYIRFLSPAHVESWRKGLAGYQTLEPWIQVGPEKLQKTLRHFQDWLQERGLKPMEVPYTRRAVKGIETLRVSESGAPERERFFRTRYAPGDLGEKQKQRLTEKMAKPQDLVVFMKVNEEGNCEECGVELAKNSLLFKENNKTLCLGCADLDHLVFLPAGDAAVTRRSRKCSLLSAVVVRFSRSRGRHERQGLLVAPAALIKAEDECAADAPERAARRAQAAVARQEEDREYVSELTEAVRKLFPSCPPEEARAIAAFTGQRGSGRVGRSAASRAFDARAIVLAVRAHIRHQQTNYDALLMQGTPRLEAREQIRDTIERIASGWSRS